MPATSAAHNSLLFLLRSFTVLMKLTRQAVRVIKQSIFRLLISMLNTVDLSIKVACFVKKVNIVISMFIKH